VFLAAVILLSGWSFLINLLSNYYLSGTNVPGLDMMHQANDAVVIGLSLLAVIAFAIAMSRVARPNKSFKPNPLRGSA
jgi:membrane-bound acyltransferase YfiQ involved in biofilm formation